MVLDAYTRPRRRRQSARPRATGRAAGPEIGKRAKTLLMALEECTRPKQRGQSLRDRHRAEAGQHEGREPREVAPFRWCLLRSADLAQLATLALGEATPDAEALVVLERVLEALGLDLAGRADLLGLARRSTLFREERLRIGLRAERGSLPSQRVVAVVGDATDTGNAQVDGVDEPVAWNRCLVGGNGHE